MAGMLLFVEVMPAELRCQVQFQVQFPRALVLPVLVLPAASKI